MKYEELQRGGVHIAHAAPETAAEGAPMLFVHGGGQGAWAWEKFLPYFAEHGRDCYAFSWFGHDGSRPATDEEMLSRSLFDVTEEIGIVVAHIGQAPVLVGHSMGTLPVQKYASDNPVVARVLLTPTPFQGVTAPDSDVPFEPGTPMLVPPFEFAYQMLFKDCTEAEARRYHTLMCPESATVLSEVALGGSLPLDRVRLSGPSLVVGAGQDAVVPIDVARRTADYFGSDYFFAAGADHGLILGSHWREIATRVRSWLETSVW